MEKSSSLMHDYTEAYAEKATWYWDAVAAANQQGLDYLKSVTEIAWRANPMVLLAPMLEKSSFMRVGEQLRDEAVNAVRTETRQNGSLHHNNGTRAKSAARAKATTAHRRGR